MLTNLEERSIYGKLDCFLEVGNDILEDNDLVDEATRDMCLLCSKRL